MPDIEHLAVKVHRCNDAIFVAADIEHIKAARLVRAVPELLEIGKRPRRRSLDNPAPCLKRIVGPRMSSRKISQRLVADQVHSVYRKKRY